MKTLTATYRIVTPMFIGDAEQKAVDVRPPSFKGALRFWWRALQWGKIRKDYQTDAEALRELHKQEGRLFGMAANDKNKKAGQSLFMLEIRAQPIKTDKLITGWPTGAFGSGYMGYGLTGTKDTPHRGGLPENQLFELNLWFKPEATDAEIQSIRESLEIFGLLGGLGSRSRRGFGSIALENLKDETIIKKFG